MQNLTPLPKNLINHDMRAWQDRNNTLHPYRATLKKLKKTLNVMRNKK